MTTPKTKTPRIVHSLHFMVAFSAFALVMNVLEVEFFKAILASFYLTVGIIVACEKATLD